MIKNHLLILILCNILWGHEIQANPVPVAFEGRYIPLDVYADCVLADSIDIPSSNQLTFLFALQFFPQEWSSQPLFLIHGQPTSYDAIKQKLIDDFQGSKRLAKAYLMQELAKRPTSHRREELKEIAQGLWIETKKEELIVFQTPEIFPWNLLPIGWVIGKRETILSDEINDSAEECKKMLSCIRKFEWLTANYRKTEQQYLTAIAHLHKGAFSPEETSQILENQFPLPVRLNSGSHLLQVIPGRNGQWHPLLSLSLTLYDPQSGKLTPLPNFTLYPDDIYQNLQNGVISLVDLPSPRDPLFTQYIADLTYQLHQGYKHIERKNLKGSILYPSQTQLIFESLYHRYPWIEILLALYVGSCLFFLIASKDRRMIDWTAWVCLIAAWMLHTLLLGTRSYLLLRPPVSNMFETLLYVPWIAILISLCLWKKHRLSLAAASAIAVLLLGLADASQLDSHLSTIQPVLNSQYWLTVHVLMVVGSYGAFLLSGVLSHVYLTRDFLGKSEFGLDRLNSARVCEKSGLSHRIVQMIYLGTTLLICGTLLGGVWAAQSWGRFWDWDPKESWAFISSALYVMIIHLYRFKKIHDFGLAVGSVMGMLAISFTWYGVNYILGTGFHSYGFGNGGEVYFYLFLVAELCFIAVMVREKYKVQKNVPQV